MSLAFGVEIAAAEKADGAGNGKAPDASNSDALDKAGDLS
jgi:hypothetical protein